MKIGLFAAVLIVAAALSSCGFVQRIDRECSYAADGGQDCVCRDIETGRFTRCP